MKADATIAECLTHLRHQYGADAPSYPMFYRAIVEGRIPAEKMGRGWFVRRDHMDRIRVAFGLPARGREA